MFPPWAFLFTGWFLMRYSSNLKFCVRSNKVGQNIQQTFMSSPKYYIPPQSGVSLRDNSVENTVKKNRQMFCQRTGICPSPVCVGESVFVKEDDLGENVGGDGCDSYLNAGHKTPPCHASSIALGLTGRLATSITKHHWNQHSKSHKCRWQVGVA